MRETPFRPRPPLQRQMAQQISAALAERAESQHVLAIRAGITEKHLSQIMRGHATGSLDVWQQLGTALGRTWEVTLR